MKKDEIMVSGTIMKHKQFVGVWAVVFTIVTLLCLWLITSKGQWLTWIFAILAVLCWIGFIFYDKLKK